jgi:hypothetical protein
MAGKHARPCLTKDCKNHVSYRRAVAGAKVLRAVHGPGEETMTVELGQRVKDTITGFEGIAIARTEWLYGCVRVTVQPQSMHDGKPIDSSTFDEPQLVGVADVVAAEPGSGRHGARPDPAPRPDSGRRA